jgi:trehalose 6-phosphate phosphatase
VKLLKEGLDLEAFFERLRAAPARVLFLDYDGTLAPFHVERQKAVPYPEVIPVLEALQRDGRTRLVVVSGRALVDLRPLLGLTRVELWGTHGWERETAAGRVEQQDPGAHVRALLKRARELAKQILPDELVEVKPVSVAGHVRGLAEQEAREIVRRLHAAWGPLQKAGQVESRDFDGGVELRIGGRDKGFVVRQVLAEEPEGAAVAYLGDDLTDEDAFVALGTRGLSVLVRDELRSTAANLWIRPPRELMKFLERWQGALASLPAMPSVS